MRKATILTIALLLALPAATVIAGPVAKAYLTRPADAADDATERGKIKIKNDRKGGLQLFSVKIQDVAAGTYGVWLVDTAEVPAEDVELGSITVDAEEDGGKLKFNTKRGDEVAVDPVGWMVEVRNADGAVVLSGLVPDPDAPKVKGNVKAKLDHPGDGDAKGFVRLKLGKGAQHLHVVGIVLEHGGPDAVGAEEAADDVPEPSEAGDDHRALLVDLVHRSLHALAGADPGLEQPLVDQQEDRGERHGDGHDGDQPAGHLTRHDALARGERPDPPPTFFHRR